MALTEQPFGSLTDGNFVAGNHGLRTSWQNSFFLPSDPLVGTVLTGSPGAVVGANGATVTFSVGGSGAQQAILAGGRYVGSVTGLQQVYISDTAGGPQAFVVDVSSATTAFPAGSLALAVLMLDRVNRLQQVIDSRPSGLSSAPNLGTMTESVTDATKRVNFQNNYYVPRTGALTPQIAQDLSLPAPGFFLGSGAVVLSGNTITTPQTYISCKTSPALAVNALNQGYIDPGTGTLAIRQTQISGTFPANSLALFEATTDSVGLIRTLVDWRPSYI